MFIKRYLENTEIGTETTQTHQVGGAKVFKLDRRQMLGGLGLSFGVVLTGCASDGGEPVIIPDFPAGDLTGVKGGDATPSLWISIEPDDVVKITCHRAEMGQQTWTAMAQIVADELEADWEKVEIVQALGDKKYGDQNTDGSRSVRFNFHRLRVAGAAMREMLERAAAIRWGVGLDEVTSENGVVKTKKGRKKASYGELAAEAAALSPRDEAELTLKTRDEWTLIGKHVASLTVPKIVKGEGTFGIDVNLPDMVYAVVARSPVLFGKLNSVDDSEALKIPGVLKTVRLPDATAPALFKALGGVAVIGVDTWAAIQGRSALQLDWDPGKNAVYNSVEYAETLRKLAREKGASVRSEGNVDTAFEGAAKTLEAEYYVPHLTQAPMEPMSATAVWNEAGELEVWACTQDPQSARNTLAQMTKTPIDKITVHGTWLGGAFGRKSKPDFIIEAALIAKEIGKPVKLQWTREDELQHGFYHSVSAQYLKGALDEDGACKGWLHRSAYPPISTTFVGRALPTAPGELWMGATDMPYAIPNIAVEGKQSAPHVRIGWLRSVGNIQHAFAVQSFVDELAHAAGRDPLDYQLELIGEARIVDLAASGTKYGNYSAPIEDYPIDTGRLANVLKIAADMAGWGRDLPEGSGLGLAVHRSFLTYVAAVAEVKVDADGGLKIPKVWMACDAGTVVNPRHVSDQMEGGFNFGLSNALYGAITAKDGAIEQINFPDYRIMRMNEAPLELDVHIVESNAPPAGVGEPGTPLAAPALANALFAATGKRYRDLPFLGPDSDTLA